MLSTLRTVLLHLTLAYPLSNTSFYICWTPPTLYWSFNRGFLWWFLRDLHKSAPKTYIFIPLSVKLLQIISLFERILLSAWEIPFHIPQWHWQHCKFILCRNTPEFVAIFYLIYSFMLIVVYLNHSIFKSLSKVIIFQHYFYYLFILYYLFMPLK
jgi:hypothetical protein